MNAHTTAAVITLFFAAVLVVVWTETDNLCEFAIVTITSICVLTALIAGLSAVAYVAYCAAIALGATP